MQRLKRVFNIDIEVCEHCGGHVKVIASIEDPAVIEQILKHLKQKVANSDTTHHHTLPPECAPPQSGLLDPSQTRLFNLLIADQSRLTYLHIAKFKSGRWLEYSMCPL